MKCVPMIFNGEMIKALLEGRKTVTRRPAKGVTYSERMGFIFNGMARGIGSSHKETMNHIINRPAKCGCPANKGDLVWVRETFCMGRIFDYDSGHPASDYLYVEQCKDDKNYPIYKQQCMSDGVELEEVRWTPSIHMPRCVSRLTLKVTDVRIEQVQSITEEQSIKEGMWPASPSSLVMPYRTTFMDVWDNIYGNWTDNPYAWVIEFEVINENIDKHIAKLNKSIKVPVYVGVKDVDADHYRFVCESFEVEPTKITRQKIRGGGYAYTVHFIGREPMIDVYKKSLAGRESKEPISNTYNPDWVPPKDGWIDDVWVPVK